MRILLGLGNPQLSETFIRKHLAETLLAKKPVLRFILAPLLTTKLVVSVKKWSQVRKAAEDDAAAADAEDQAAAESLEAVARLVEEAQAEQFTAEPEEPRRSGAGEGVETGRATRGLA